MRKLSEIRGEDALDVLAELLEPASEIFTDDDFVTNIRNGNKLQAAVVVLHAHKKAVLRVLATLEGVPIEEYKPTVVEIPKLILEVLNDPDIVSVFTFAEPKRPSGSATANTKGTGKK